MLILLVTLAAIFFAWKYLTSEAPPPETKQENVDEPIAVKPGPPKKKKAKRQKVMAYTTESPLLYAELKSHSKPILDVKWSHQGRFLLSSAKDRTVRVWRVKDEDVLSSSSCYSNTLNLSLDQASKITFSQDDRFMLGIYERSRKFFVYALPEKSKDGTTVRSFSKKPVLDAHPEPCPDFTPFAALDWSPDRTLAMTISSDTSIHIANLSDGSSYASFQLQQLHNHDAAFSPDGKYLALGTFSGGRIYSLTEKKTEHHSIPGSHRGQFALAMQLSKGGHSSGVLCLAWDWDSQRLYTAGKDQTIKCWDVGNVRYRDGACPECLWTSCGSFKHMPGRLAVGPKPKHIMAVSDGRDIVLLDTQDGRFRARIEGAHVDDVHALSFSADGQLLASSCIEEKIIRLWNTLV